MQNGYKDRLKQAISESGMSYSEIARALTNVTPQAVRAWAIGLSVPSNEKIPLLAKLLRKSESWLLTGTGEETVVVDEDVISIPLLDVRVSAGNGAMLFEDEQVLKKIELDIHWLRSQCRFSHPDKLYALTASGDSMEPTLSNGDFILVDTGIDSIRSDSIYVARVNDCLYVKRFQKTPRGTFLMISDNPVYKEFEVEPERDNLCVIGKVVYHWHGTSH